MDKTLIKYGLGFQVLNLVTLFFIWLSSLDWSWLSFDNLILIIGGSIYGLLNIASLVCIIVGLLTK